MWVSRIINHLVGSCMVLPPITIFELFYTACNFCFHTLCVSSNELCGQVKKIIIEKYFSVFCLIEVKIFIYNKLNENVTTLLNGLNINNYLKYLGNRNILWNWLSWKDELINYPPIYLYHFYIPWIVYNTLRIYRCYTSAKFAIYFKIRNCIQIM